jgi:hypothetical protein
LGHRGTFCFCYHLTAKLSPEDAVIMQYVPQRGSFFFCYNLTAQLSDLRTVSGCNLWRKENLLFILSFKSKHCDVRTVLEYNIGRIVETSPSVITNITTLLRENGVRVQYVAHRSSFCFCYNITTQLCDVRNV